MTRPDKFQVQRLTPSGTWRIAASAKRYRLAAIMAHLISVQSKTRTRVVMVQS